MAHSAARGVACGPALTRTGVRRVTIGTQRTAVDPRIRYGVDDLIARAAEHRGGDRRRSNAHEQHVIEADAIEAVLQRSDALDLVRLDHRRQHIANHQALLALRSTAAREIVRDGEDCAEVVGRMAPLRREPGVIEIEPADHRADVESGLHRIELVRSARHACAAGQRCAWNHRPHQLGARRVLQRLEAAGERIHEAVVRGLVGGVAVDAVGQRVIGDIGENFVGGGSFGGLVIVGRHAYVKSSRFTFSRRAARTSGSRARCSWRSAG